MVKINVVRIHASPLNLENMIIKENVEINGVDKKVILHLGCKNCKNRLKGMTTRGEIYFGVVVPGCFYFSKLDGGDMFEGYCTKYESVE